MEIFEDAQLVLFNFRQDFSNKPLHSQGIYIQFPQPLTFAQSIVLLTIKNLVFSLSLNQISSFRQYSLSYSGWQGMFCISYSSLFCNKNITSSTKMNQVVFLMSPFHFLLLQLLSHHLLQFLDEHQHLLMVWKTVSLLMSNELKSCVDYYLELLSVDLSRLFPLQFFSPNILGTVCFLLFTKTKTGPYGLNI